MPANKKHHYVPRFYLRQFARDGNSIDLFNFRLNRTISGANYKQQCYRDYMYGKEPETEKSLGQLEGVMAQLLRQILARGLLPPPFSPDHESLCVFTLLQSARTAYSADALDDAADGLWKKVFDKDPWFDPELLKNVRIVNSDPANLAVFFMLRHYHLIMDLGYKLLLARPESVFITSDNPVVLYNQLLEHERFGSATGLVSKGLQIFLPLSPSALLMFYDRDVYAVSPRDALTITVSEVADMTQLNALQVVAALENVYFSGSDANIYRVVEAGKRYRRPKKTLTFTTQERATPTGSSQLIGTSRADIRTGLTLSFTKLLKPAKRWREDRMKPGLKQAVVPRDPRLLKEHEAFSLLVDQGKYQPTEFFRYLQERG